VGSPRPVGTASVAEEQSRATPGLIPRPLAYGLIVLIAGLWGFDVLRSLLDPGHQVNTTLGTAFMIIAGLLGGFAKGKTPVPPQATPTQDPPPVDPPPEPPPADEPEPLPPGALSVAEILARLAADNNDTDRPPGRHR
jgi:hypothetical protein